MKFLILISTLVSLLGGIRCHGHGQPRYNQELSTILSKLWDLDHTRCNPEQDYNLNLQGYVNSMNWNLTDRARTNLFSSFNESRVFAKPTYRSFKSLLDNYAEDTGIEEQESNQERGEVDEFLNLVMNTSVMREAHTFLVGKGKATSNRQQFKNLLYELWFKLYKRLHQDRQKNSCGFEHVFVGEKRGSEVSGFHNWIQFYLQERDGHLDYRGYFRRGTTEEIETHPRLMTLQFIWKGRSGKSIGSMLVGTSPEFEMSMYTLVYLMSYRNHPAVELKNYKLEVSTYSHGRSIGSAFPRSLSN